MKHEKLSAVKQCGFCNRIYPDYITMPYDAQTCCWHCLFFLNSDDVTRVEEMYQITLDSYLAFCEVSHKSENCIRPDSCMICLSKPSDDSMINKQNDVNKIDRFIETIQNDRRDDSLEDDIEFVISI